MNARLKILNAFYPLLMWVQKITGAPRNTLKPSTMTNAPVPFHALEATSNSGKPFAFESVKGKYVLLVNTASACGYTPQYNALEQLHQQYKHKLTVIGFPSNDFGGQEPGSDADIANFCQVNFGVTFPLMQKAPVTGKDQQPVYHWLTNPDLNGWNQQAPAWNFCKYLVSPDGMLVEYFGAGVDPLDHAITKHLS